MNTKLFIVEKPARLTCIWVPTGDPRTPLVRQWMSTPSLDDQEGGLRWCA
jgi:hypothetical protein